MKISLTTANFVKESDLYTILVADPPRRSKGVIVKGKFWNDGKDRVFEEIVEAPRALEFKSEDFLDKSKNKITSRRKVYHQKFRAQGVADAAGNLGKTNYWYAPVLPQGGKVSKNWWDENDMKKAKAVEAYANKPSAWGSNKECKADKTLTPKAFSACAIAR